MQTKVKSIAIRLLNGSFLCKRSVKSSKYEITLHDMVEMRQGFSCFLCIFRSIKKQIICAIDIYLPGTFFSACFLHVSFIILRAPTINRTKKLCMLKFAFHSLHSDKCAHMLYGEYLN